MFGASKTRIGEIRGEEKEGGTQRAEVGLRVRVVCLPVVCGNNHWKTIYIIILRSYIVYVHMYNDVSQKQGQRWGSGVGVMSAVRGNKHWEKI